jgi:TatD DNase family protein
MAQLHPRRHENGQVDRALCICTTLEEFEAVHALATTHDNFHQSVVAPDNEDVQEPSFDDLVQRAALPRSSASARPGWTTFAWATRGG